MPSLGVFDQAADQESDATPSEVTSDNSPAADVEDESETEDEQEEGEEDDAGGLYDSATDDEADDSAFACGSAGLPPAEAFHSKPPVKSMPLGDTAATNLPVPAATSPQQQTMSSGETDVQRQRRMERYRQSLQAERAQNAKQAGKEASGSGSSSSCGSGSGAAAGEDEEWQTALKDVQRLGASQRRMDALQRASAPRVDSADDGPAPLKSESSDRNGEDKKPKALSLSAPPRPMPSSAVANTQKKQSTTRKKGSGGGILLGGSGGAAGVGSGVSRLLSLQPAAPAPRAATAAAADGPESETDDEDIVCTGFRKAGE